MTKNNLAVALCRVSSIEQLENNSLGHQKGNVLKAAAELGVSIPSDAVWEGAVSSKKGVNFDRKDLKEIYEYCRKHTAVKYVIVQEVDRFMRSPDEQTYFYVKFWYELRVRIWFADKPELNEDTHIASLLRYMEGWRAAGSNEERQNKSINGQTAALKDGRYPFSPKPGYKRGSVTGIPEVHPVRGPILRNVLIRVATGLVTPTKGLIELNKSEYTNERAPIKMDRFRKIATDPFYAGIVEISKQVRVRNETALHEPLINLEQHVALVRIFDSKKKNQLGPRKNGNPEYPLSNLVTCALCTGNSAIPRYVGYKHSNGKNPNLVYHKYRCRVCKRYITREELHPKVVQHFKEYSLAQEAVNDFLEALDVVWKQKEAQAEQDIARIKQKITKLNQTISSQAIAAIDPSNITIKPEILSSIEKTKEEISELANDLSRITQKGETDKSAFLKFALNFASRMGEGFLNISKENRLRCKQIVFPAGFYLDAQNKVYTPEISPLIRLAATKKDLPKFEKSLLVRVQGL